MLDVMLIVVGGYNFNERLEGYNNSKYTTTCKY